MRTATRKLGVLKNFDVSGTKKWLGKLYKLPDVGRRKRTLSITIIPSSPGADGFYRSGELCAPLSDINGLKLIRGVTPPADLVATFLKTCGGDTLLSQAVRLAQAAPGLHQKVSFERQHPETHFPKEMTFEDHELAMQDGAFLLAGDLHCIATSREVVDPGLPSIRILDADTLGTVRMARTTCIACVMTGTLQY